MPVIRRRALTIAAKFEATPGVDAFGGNPSVATDFFKADVTVTFNQQAIPNPELAGGLDASAAIPGGTKVQIELTCMLKGSGVAGVAPQWGTLMQACGYIQTITASAIGAPTAATAGTSNSATLASPFAATAQLYRGMPLIVSGNPASPITAPITDYSASRVATLGYNFAAPLSSSTLAQIPANVLYSPTSLRASIKSVTIYVFMDGLLWRIPGCVGTFTATLPTGQPGMLKFTMTGQYLAPVAQATPTGIVFDATQPPILRNGIARLGGQLARTSQITFDAGNTLVEPENPEAGQGFDPSEITVRDTKGTFDPLMSVTDTIARVASFQSGQTQSVTAVLGSAVGNTISFAAPSTIYTGLSPSNRNDLMAETINFDANGTDASLFVAVS